MRRPHRPRPHVLRWCRSQHRISLLRFRDRKGTSGWVSFSHILSTTALTPFQRRPCSPRNPPLYQARDRCDSGRRSRRRYHNVLTHDDPRRTFQRQDRVRLLAPRARLRRRIVLLPAAPDRLRACPARRHDCFDIPRR